MSQWNLRADICLSPFSSMNFRHLVPVFLIFSLVGCKQQENLLGLLELSSNSVGFVGGGSEVVVTEGLAGQPAAKTVGQLATEGGQAGNSGESPVYSAPASLIGLIRTFSPNGEILNVDTSADGKALVFESSASNLVRGDTNQTTDVFLMLPENRLLKRISVDSDGNQVVGNSVNPRISPDGGWVVYETSARGLDGRDQNQFRDIYLYEVGTETTTLVSVSLSDTAGNRDSRNPVVSFDAKTIAFESEATNLVSGDENKSSDVFVYNRFIESVNLVSSPVRTSGDQTGQQNMASYKPDLSDNGLYVVYESFSPFLALDDFNSNADIFLHSLEDLSTVLISKFGPKGAVVAGDSTNPSISSDGKTVVFQSLGRILPDDTNDVQDSYMYQATGKKLTKLPAEALFTDDMPEFIGSYGPVISGDGVVVVYQTKFLSKPAEDLQKSHNAQLVYYDTARSTASTLNFSQSDGGARPNVQSYSLSLSFDAETLAFHVSQVDNGKDARLISKTAWLAKKAGND